MDNIKSILKQKGSHVWTISPEESVYRALQILAEKGIGALLVVEGEKIAGIFSERDYARKVILKGRSSANTKIKELMIKNVLYAHPDYSIEKCMAIMTENKIRHLPILEEESEKLLGMITIGDIVNYIISRQKFEIQELKKYITGSYS